MIGPGHSHSNLQYIATHMATYIVTSTLDTNAHLRRIFQVLLQLPFKLVEMFGFGIHELLLIPDPGFEGCSGRVSSSDEEGEERRGEERRGEE